MFTRYSPILFILHDVDVQDLNILLRLLLVRPHIFDLMNHIKPLCSTAKDGMLPVQPWLSHPLVLDFKYL